MVLSITSSSDRSDYNAPTFPQTPNPNRKPKQCFPNPRHHSTIRQTKPNYDDFVLIIPVIREHARISFLKLGPEEREEMIEECVASAFKTYVRLIELKKADLVYPSVLATFAVRQVRDGRKVGGSLNTNDVLSRYAQKRKPITIERLDRFDADEDQWVEAVVEDDDTPVPDQAAFRIDFPAWLKKYQQPKRRIVEASGVRLHHGRSSNAFQFISRSNQPTPKTVRDIVERLSRRSTRGLSPRTNSCCLIQVILDDREGTSAMQRRCD